MPLQTMVDFLSSQEGFKFTYQWYRSTEVDLNKLCTMVSSDNALHLSRTSFVQNRPTTRIKIRWVIDRKTVRSKILKAIRLGMRLMGVLVCSVCCVHHQKGSYCGSVFCWVDRPLFVNGLRRAELRWIQSLKDGKSQSNPKFFAFITGN